MSVGIGFTAYTHGFSTFTHRFLPSLYVNFLVVGGEITRERKEMREEFEFSLLN
jgi:hypothetical protein